MVVLLLASAYDFIYVSLGSVDQTLYGDMDMNCMKLYTLTLAML